MSPALLEIFGLIGLLLAGAFLVRFAWRHLTTRGLRRVLEDNTHDLEALVEQTCLTHGYQAIDTLVLRNGEPYCRECLKAQRFRAKRAAETSTNPANPDRPQSKSNRTSPPTTE